MRARVATTSRTRSMPDQSSLVSHQSLSKAFQPNSRLNASRPSLPSPATALTFSVQSLCSHVHALCTALFTPCRLPPTKGVDLMERKTVLKAIT